MDKMFLFPNFSAPVLMGFTQLLTEHLLWLKQALTKHTRKTAVSE